MNRLIGWATLATALVAVPLASVDAGHRAGCRSCCCPCPCACAPAGQPAAPEATPPTPPAAGESQQSQSVEPPAAAAPPAAPSAGRTYRSYSVAPRGVSGAVRSSRGYSPEQRLHPSNRLKGPGNF